MVTLRILTTDKRLPDGMLSVVWQANAIDDGVFLTPTFVDRPDAQFEEYPDVRIVHRKSRPDATALDPRVSFVSKSERGNRVLAAVAAHFGLDVEE